MPLDPSIILHTSDALNKLPDTGNAIGSAAGQANSYFALKDHTLAVLLAGMGGCNGA